jgi:hypothetical protein
MSRGLIVTDALARDATALRRVFDDRYADPRSTRADRFAWDYWHVPDQYTHLRTPAWTYFPAKLYDGVHRKLVAWGRDHLGCHDISPPWLSLYVDGCRQELHGDLPHGPWAFVLSLTRWRERTFTGGETVMLRDDVLEMWTSFQSVRGVEEREIVRSIAPELGRLVVFDPRVPHGVRCVRGTHDPREGRLVIHGWFVQPRPFIAGPLRTSALASRIGDLTGALGGWLGDLPIAGLLSFAFTVDRGGGVSAVKALSDTTRVPSHDEPARKRLVRRIATAIEAWRFAPQRRPSRVTLPLVFERG